MSHADIGLANERTALAWQRTSLSIAAGSAIIARLTIDQLGIVSLITLGIATTLSIWVFAESRWRYLQHAGAAQRRHPRGGYAALALSVATILIGLTEIAALLYPSSR